MGWLNKVSGVIRDGRAMIAEGQKFVSDARMVTAEFKKQVDRMEKIADVVKAITGD